MAENLGSLGKFYVGVGVDLSELRAGMSAAVGQIKNASDVIKQSTQNISNGFKNATQSAVGFAAGMAGLQGLQSIFENTVGAGWEFNSMMQQSMISFKTLLGGSQEATDKLLNDLYQMAATTPFEFPQLAQSAKQMMAMGFEANKLIPTLTSIGDAAAGLGMGQEGIERIVRALGQMQMKGKVSGEEMRQLAEAGIPAWDMLAKAMGISTGEVMKLSEKGLIPASKAVDTLVAGMEQRFPNMMAAQSKSFNGLMSTLRDSLNQTFGQVMKPLFEDFTNNVLPKLVDGVSNFSNVLTKSGLKEAFKTIFPPGLVDGVIIAFKALDAIIQFIHQHATLFKAVLTALVAGFIAYRAAVLVSTIATTASAVAYALQTGAVGLATTGTIALQLANIAATASMVASTVATQGLAAGFVALAAAMNINPVVLAITAAVAVLVGLGYLIYKNWDAVRKFFVDLWNGLVKLFTASVSAVINLWIDMELGITKSIAKLVELVFPGLKKGLDGVIGWLEGAAKTAKDKVNEITSDVNKAASFKVTEVPAPTVSKPKTKGSGSPQTDSKTPETPSWSSSDLGAGVTNKSAYDLAKAQYEADLEMTKRSEAEKLQLYKDTLSGVKKDAAEELDYKKGLYKAEQEAKQEQVELEKAALDRELLDETLIAQQKYEKRKSKLNLDLQAAKGNAVQQAQIEYQLKQLEIDYTNEVRDAKLEAAARLRELEQQQLEFKNSNIEYERSLGLISADEELQLKKQTIDQKYALDREGLEAERSKYAESTEDYKNYTQKLTLLDRQYNQDMLENERESFRERNKLWFDMVDNVSSSVKQCTQELAKGTMSWKQAFASVGQAVKDTIIDSFAQMLADWIKKLGIMLIQYIANKTAIKLFNKTSDAAGKSTAVAAATAEAAAVSGVKATAAATDFLQAKLSAKMVAATGAAVATATVGATAASITACLTMLTGMASAIAAIYPIGTAMAPAMFAGIGAATASLAGATAAATAGIAASMAPVMSFDVGTWSVPTDMLAQIHKGEVIVPEKFSDKARQVLSGEGTGQAQSVNVNYNVNALDAKGVKSMLKEHGRVIVDVIKEQNRNFAFSK